ncbi:MAG: response regulator [Planctomycetes bacterium]|nr:response regulator [Planctomycetota bacterium]
MVLQAEPDCHSPYSLLITDDDQGFRETLQGIFEHEGFRTFLAGSGEEAIDIVRDHSVHLALLDQHLPRLTGLETLRIIRQMNAILPVILLTGEYTQQLMREALAIQAYTVIPKPVSRNVVVYTVRRALAFYTDPFRNISGDVHPGDHFSV